MSRLRGLFCLGQIALSLAAASSSAECNYEMEILFLQDTSGSFNTWASVWRSAVGHLNEALTKEYGTYKIGLSSFTDKPVPLRGYGAYGGYHGYQQDFCYENNIELTSDMAAFNEGIDSLRFAAGGDVAEAQFEAMLYAALDQQVGWSPPEKTHDEHGRPIARVLLMITDADSHVAGKAAEGINFYNAPREYPDGFEGESTGGFGSHAQLKSFAVNTYFGNDVLYAELAGLYRVKDAYAAGQGPPLTDAQLDRMSTLQKTFFPERVDELETPVHPGDNRYASQCAKTEYPDFAQTAKALADKHIYPIFVLTTSNIKSFYEKYAQELDTQYVISLMNNDLASTLIAAIGDIVDKVCLSTTTPAPPVVTKEESKTPGTQEAGPGENKTKEEDKTEGNGSGGEDKTEEHGSGEDTTEETTTVAAVVVPPVVEESGGNAGTIAGATAGAVAGLAALGGLLYKTAGFGMFGAGGDAVTNADQVEVPENNVEREAMEQVTMDMFS